MSPMRPWNVVLLSTSGSVGAALIALAYIQLSPERRPIIDAYMGGILLISAVLVGLRMRGDATTEDAFNAGRDAGYEKGYADGRRVGRPVVVPLPMSAERAAEQVAETAFN